MPIVTCPTCHTRYDPGVDETPAELPAKLVCPSCGQWLGPPEQEPINPPEDGPHTREESIPRSSSEGALAELPARPWGDDEGRPRRRRARSDDSRRRDEDPNRPWIDQAAEDYTDDPLNRRPPADGFGIASICVGICSCLLVCPGICCFVIDGLSLLGGITAVILGFVARRRRKSGFGLAGIITGTIAILLSLAWIGYNVISLMIAMAN